MDAFDELPHQPSSATSGGPVFVDASGRRLRRLKLLGIGALALATGYVFLLLLALVGGPNIAAPYLPLPAAPEARDLPSSKPVPASDAPGRTAAESPSAEPPASSADRAPVDPASGVPGSAALGSAAVQRGAAVPATVPDAAPTSPGKSGSAPGRTARPSAPTHP